VQQLRAIIYVPDDEDRDRWEARCLEYCDRRRYRVVALVVGGPERWDDAMDMMYAREADVLVVASKMHLPPDRTPRVEAVTDEFSRIEDGPSHRRTRVIRRDGEA
jgi:hypothetical protein